MSGMHCHHASAGIAFVMRVLGICFLVLLAAPTNAHAQTLQPQLATASDLLQDKDGFVWAAGPQGVVRFDGVEAMAVLEKHPALTAGAHRLFEDTASRVWIATGSGDLSALEADGLFHIGSRVGPAGLLRLDGEHADVILEPSEKSSHWIWAFAQDAQGDVWAGTESGLVLIRGKEVKHISLGPDPAGNFVTGLWFDPQNQLWIATAAGLKRFNPSTQRLVLGPIHAPVRALIANGPVAAALATDTTIWSFNGAHLTPVGTSDETRRLAVDAEQRIWVGGIPGVKRLGSIEPFVPRTAAGKSAISALLVDRDGGLWMGAVDGVTRVRPEPFVNPLPGSSGASLAVLAISDGSVWAPSMSGLVRMRPDGVSERIAERGQLPFFRTLTEGPDHTVWFGGSGLYRWLQGGISVMAAKDVPTGQVRQVAIAPDGSVWLADMASTLWRFTNLAMNHTPTIFTPANGLCPGRIMFIYPTKSGRVWLGGRAGLTRIENGKARCFTTASGLPANDVTDALEDDDGTLWITMIGTSSLARLRKGRFEDVGAAYGLPRGGFYGIVEDRKSRFWFSSARGVVNVSRSDLDADAEGAAAPAPFNVITTQQGLASDACALAGHPPLSLDATGLLWVPTAQGVFSIDTTQVGHFATARATLTYVEVGGTRVSSRGTIHMPPRPNRLEVGFGAATFDFPNSSRFQVMLAGLDRAWQEPQTQRRAVYNDLPPGAYALKVRMLRTGQSRTDSDISLQVVVSPRFYETLWWKVLVAASLLALTASWLWRRQRQARREVAQIYLERARIARELHDSLAQVFMGLGFQVDALRSTAKQPAWREKLEQLRALIDSAGKQVHEAVWQLRQPSGESALADAIRSVVAQAKRNLGLQVNLELGNRLPKAGPITHELPRILEEAITNACKHGRAKQVHIRVLIEEADLVMRIEDDGAGSVGGPQRDKEGFGLLGMRERAAQCGGSLVTGTRPQGRGFCVEVRVPAGFREVVVSKKLAP